MIRKLTLLQWVAIIGCVITVGGAIISIYLYVSNNEKRAEEIRTQYAVDKDRNIRQRDSLFQVVTAQGVQINELKVAFAAHDAKDVTNKAEFDIRMDATETGLKVLETRFNDFIYYKSKK